MILNHCYKEVRIPRGLVEVKRHEEYQKIHKRKYSKKKSKLFSSDHLENEHFLFESIEFPRSNLNDIFIRLLLSYSAKNEW